MAVTMQDIARDLNVSVVTVSKALRHQGSISVATRNRVLQRARELNYQMNWVARSLVTRRTYTIGLLLPDFQHPFFAEIAKAVAETVRPRGYHVIISYFEEDPELEATEVESLVARQVDGLIVASAQTPESGLFQNIRQRKIPFVLIDRPIAGSRVSFVGTDNEALGRLATEHLIAQGCQRIAHLRGPAGLGIAAARMAGYRKALAKHKLSMPTEYVVEARYDDDMGFRGMQRLLGRKPPPDGVVCYNDPVAIGAMKAILAAGLNVPRDIAIIGAGNVHYSDLLAVPLTTVDQGATLIGDQASEILLQQISSKRTLCPKAILIKPRLVIRKSTARQPTEVSSSIII
jgi:LacI family transcriptional regulator